MQLELVTVFLVLLLWCSGDRRAGALLVGGIALLGEGTAAGCSGDHCAGALLVGGIALLGDGTAAGCSGGRRAGALLVGGIAGRWYCCRMQWWSSRWCSPW